MCTAIIQQEYSLAVLRQSLLYELFRDCGHKVVKESILEKFCSHPYFLLIVIDNRKMHSIPKMQWFLNLTSHRKFHLISSITLTHTRTVILFLFYLSWSLHQLKCCWADTSKSVHDYHHCKSVVAQIYAVAHSYGIIHYTILQPHCQQTLNPLIYSFLMPCHL